MNIKIPDETTYLKRLKFDPRLQDSWVAKYLSNIRLVFLILFAVVILGVFSYMTLPRNLNPEIKIPIVIVQTVLPGAGPKDVESLITIPIETEVRGIENVKTVTSTSQDSVSIVSIEFKSGVDPDKARTDTQSAVDTVQDLPTDAQTPKVTKVDFENQPVWQFTLSGTEDVASLNRFAKDLQKKLEDVTSLKSVTLSGLEEQEIQVLVKPQSISTYKLNPPILAQAIKTAAGSLPAGTIKSQNSDFSLSIDPAITSVNDVRNLKLSVSGQIVALSDLATISERSKPSQNESFIASKTQAAARTISFSVFRNTSGGVTIDQAVTDAKKVVDNSLLASGNRYKVYSVLDTSDSINKQFDDLQRDFILTIVLVFIILFIFLGLRQASVALLATPLTFFITFTVMKITGIALSFIAQFSLLLSLGLLVDDTIVVISAMSSYFRTGKFTPLQTGLLVWRDFFIPILTTTITTVWAFIPLLLASGIIGEFIKPIPIVVSTSLMGSFVVAMLITLPLLIILLQGSMPRRVSVLLRILLVLVIVAAFYFLISKTDLLLLQLLVLIIFVLIILQTRGAWANMIKKLTKRKANLRDKIDRNYINHGVISFSRIDNGYQRLITKILASPQNRKRTLIMVAIFSLFSYLLVPLGFVQNEFFPKTDEDWVFVSVELPAGTDLEVTKKETLVLLEKLRLTEDAKFVLAETGQGLNTGFGVGSSGGNITLLTLALEEKGKRHKTSTEVAQDLRQQFSDYSKGRLAVEEVSGGPPAGADLQIKLLGDDLPTLDTYANKIQDYLKTQAATTNVDKSIKSGTSKVTFVPDQMKLNQSGLSFDLVGLWLRTFASGFTGPKLRFPSDTEDRDLTIRLNSNTQQVADIASLQIPTMTGEIVPISSVGKLVMEPNPTLITREDGKRTISVSASVLPGNPIPALNSNLEKFADSLNLPSGYSWKTGGVNDENQRSVQSILQAMLLSFLLIITTMVVQFSSFRKALIVMMVIPLSISGVFIIFALSQTPLSFPALIGILALFGIVVKNSILVVDKINVNVNSGMEFNQAVVDGSVSRLEAIALTSLATIIGLTPITLSDPLWRGLGGAIIAGLTFSGTIMLFFIPVVYYYLFHPSKKVVYQLRTQVAKRAKIK